MTAARRDFLDVLFRWCLLIGMVISGALAVGSYSSDEWQLEALGIGFGLFSLTMVWCRLLLARGKLALAERTFLVFATLLVIGYHLVMPDLHYLMAVVGYIMFIRIVSFFEGVTAAASVGVTYAVVFTVSMVVRQEASTSIAPLRGVQGFAITYAIPVIVLMMYSLIDRTFSVHLDRALSESEDARHTLETRNSELLEQKLILQDNESRLAAAAEEQARINDELRLANDEIKSFAYVVSHDLRAPLINIRGFSDELRECHAEIEKWLGETAPDTRDEFAKRVRSLLDGDISMALSFIDTSVQKMDRYIKAVLRLSRLGRRDLEWELVDCAELVRQSLDAVRHQIDRKHVEVEMEALPTIYSDRVSLEQIFGNLITNAVNYLVEDRPGKITIRSQEADDGICLSVGDTGRGIDAENVPRAFEPLQRIGRPKTPGEGMGLAYVQSAVRRLGGRVTCRSTPGKGSVFSVTLPYREKENA